MLGMLSIRHLLYLPLLLFNYELAATNISFSQRSCAAQLEEITPSSSFAPGNEGRFVLPKHRRVVTGNRAPKKVIRIQETRHSSWQAKSFSFVWKQEGINTNDGPVSRIARFRHCLHLLLILQDLTSCRQNFPLAYLQLACDYSHCSAHVSEQT